MPQYQDFGFQLPPRLEAVAQHADEQEGNCNHVTRCSDSPRSASQEDGLFGSDSQASKARVIASGIAQCARLADDAAPIEMRCGPLGDRQSESMTLGSARVRISSAPCSLSAQHDMGRKFGSGTFGHGETKRL
jgi:hypothetical protein